MDNPNSCNTFLCCFRSRLNTFEAVDLSSEELAALAAAGGGLVVKKIDAWLTFGGGDLQPSVLMICFFVWNREIQDL